MNREGESDRETETERQKDRATKSEVQSKRERETETERALAVLLESPVPMAWLGDRFNCCTSSEAGEIHFEDVRLNQWCMIVDSDIEVFV